jgi:hypothetical protein
MRRWTRILIIGGTTTIVLLGLWLRRSTEVTAVITAAYVILVFFQLQVMQDQHRADQAERRKMAERRTDAQKGPPCGSAAETIRLGLIWEQKPRWQ